MTSPLEFQHGDLRPTGTDSGSPVRDEGLPVPSPRRPFRLLYLVSHPIQYQAPLLRSLAARPDIDLRVLFLSDVTLRRFHDPGFGREMQWDVPLLGGYEHAFLPAFGSTQRISFTRPFTRRLAKALDGDWDALWVHGYYHQANLRAILRASVTGLPVLLRGESQLMARRGRGLGRYARDLAIRSVLNRTARCLAVGKANAAFYRHHGVDEERIFSVPYTVDNEFFRERSRATHDERVDLRSSIGIHDGRPIVLAASKLLQKKRPLDLLRAWERATARLPKARKPHLVYIGTGPLQGRLEHLTRVQPDVHVVGFRNQTELPQWYGLSDVMVLPSDFEPWGLVVNESMASGTAVIASDRVGSAPDLIVPGETGHVFPVGDTKRLADRLEDVIAEPGRSKELGAGARKHIMDGYSFDADYRGLVAALDSLG